MIGSRRSYTTPRVELIELDNEISLTLESDNPEGEPTFTQMPEYFRNDPFKTNNV